jgi:hypothetical protein
VPARDGWAGPGWSNVPISANPIHGYVDGSIYLQYVHNPADLLEVRFGTIVESEIAATFLIAIRFEFEMSGFRDRQAVFTTMIRLPKELGAYGSIN